MSEKFKRTHFVNDWSLQIRYIGLTFIVMVLFLAVSIYIVYVTGWVHMVDKLSQIYPQGRAVRSCSLCRCVSNEWNSIYA